MSRRLLTFALILVAAQSAGAQIIDAGGAGRRFGQPNSWVSLGIGWLNQGGLCDPDTDSCWNFGSALQWRASLEYPIGRGTTIGVAATTARVPMVYQAQLVCFNGCDADANVSQYLAQLHLGGGTGIQQAIDISAGMTSFTNFRSADTGTRLEPMKAVSNFSFGVAYGLALPIRQNFLLTLTQEYGQIIGKRMPGQSSNSAQQNVTRLGVRMGLGL
jgi:opacity protein-like surface antigen